MAVGGVGAEIGEGVAAELHQARLQIAKLERA